MKVLYCIMLLWAAVLLTAVLGYYRTSWDVLYDAVLLAGYIGMYGVSYLQQKRFVIMDSKFYYCSFKKWYSGNMEEIERVEKVDNGIVIHAQRGSNGGGRLGQLLPSGRPQKPDAAYNLGRIPEWRTGKKLWE